MSESSLTDRLERERQHGYAILEQDERNWGWQTPAGEIRRERRLDWLTRGLEGARGPVLEIGAGTGTFTRGLAGRLPGLEAIDISEPLLAVARQRCPEVVFRRMDAHDLQYPDEHFEAIVGCSVLHHLDWNRALLGFFRKLKRRGVLRFSEPNLLNPQIFLQKTVPWLKKRAGDSPDEYAFTARDFRPSLQRAGFTDVEVRPFEFLHPATPPRWIPLVIRIEERLSRTPLRAIAGSLLISARKAEPT
jgi:SAM-dependent methyltransferase